MDAESITAVSQKPRSSNRLRHGGYSRQPLAALPKRADYLRKKIAKFRATLEQAVQERHGTISVGHAMAIHSAATHFGLSEIWQRRLRDEWGTIATAALAEVTDRVSRELDRRDAAIARLGIDSGAAPSIAAMLFGDGAARSRLAAPANGAGASPATPNAGANV